MLGRLLGRQRVQVGRVAVIGTEVELVDGLDVVAQVAVVAATAGVGRERLGQLDHVGDFARRVAGVGQSHGLVMRVLVDIAMFGDEFGDARPAPDRPVVLTDVDLGIGHLVERVLHIGSPAQGVARLRAAYRQQVVHGLGQVLGAAVQLLVRNREGQFSRRLGTRHIVEDKTYTVQRQFLCRLRDQLGRLQNADCAIGHVLAQARVDESLR